MFRIRLDGTWTKLNSIHWKLSFRKEILNSNMARNILEYLRRRGILLFDCGLKGCFPTRSFKFRRSSCSFLFRWTVRNFYLLSFFHKISEYRQNEIGKRLNLTGTEIELYYAIFCTLSSSSQLIWSTAVTGFQFFYLIKFHNELTGRSDNKNKTVWSMVNNLTNRKSWYNICVELLVDGVLHTHTLELEKFLPLTVQQQVIPLFATTMGILYHLDVLLQ